MDWAGVRGFSRSVWEDLLLKYIIRGGLDPSQAELFKKLITLLVNCMQQDYSSFTPITNQTFVSKLIKKFIWTNQNQCHASSFELILVLKQICFLNKYYFETVFEPSCFDLRPKNMNTPFPKHKKVLFWKRLFEIFWPYFKNLSLRGLSVYATVWCEMVVFPF